MEEDAKQSPSTPDGSEAQNTYRPPRSYVLKDSTRIAKSAGKNELSPEAVENIRTFFEAFSKSTDNFVIGIKQDDFQEDHSDGFGLINYWGNEWYTGKYAGLLKDEKTGDVYFLHSRFDVDTDEQYNFTNYILSKALQLNSRIFPNMQIQRNRDEALTLLLAVVFVEQIREAFKSGMFRCYRNFENNDSRVRGRIQVERHIRQNPIFNGKISYTYREYTADNAINRIILTAYHCLAHENGAFMRSLLNSPKNRTVKDFFVQLGNITSPASRQEVQQLLKTNKQKIHHSVYRKWESVRKTAIQILRHAGIRTYESGNSEISGVLIDMTSAWEKYLEQVLNREFQFKAQHSQAILEGKRQLRPDFLDENKKVVLDAKYKNRWSDAAEKDDSEDKRGNSWDRGDTFQILSYMYVFNCDIGGIICPAHERRAKSEYPIHEKNLPGKKVALLPLIIPKDSKDTKDFASFTAAMEKSEENLRKRIQDLIKGPDDNEKTS